MPKYAVGGDSGTIIQNTGAAGAKAVQARTYVSSKRPSHRASRHDIGSSIQPPANAAGSLSPPRYMDVQATIKKCSENPTEFEKIYEKMQEKAEVWNQLSELQKQHSELREELMRARRASRRSAA